MTPKERLLAVLRGQAADRVSWSPNPAYWWEAQTDEFVKKGELEFLQNVGADPLFRGILVLVELFGVDTENSKKQ